MRLPGNRPFRSEEFLESYERMADDAPDIFDRAEQFYQQLERERQPSAETIWQAQKPELKPEPPQKRQKCDNGLYRPVDDLGRRLILGVDRDTQSFSELACALNMTVSATSGRYYRARNKLLREYSENADWIDRHGIDVDAWAEEVA